MDADVLRFEPYSVFCRNPSRDLVTFLTRHSTQRSVSLGPCGHPRGSRKKHMKFKDWASLGRVLLFYLGTVVVLATAAPLAPHEPWQTHVLFIGAMASSGTFILTILFARWEGLRLGDVGIWFDRRSAKSLITGFLTGLGLVASHTGIAWSAGHVRWVPAQGFSLLDAILTLIAFLLLSVREELAFHGYTLRRLNTLTGFWIALSITSFVFALEHRAGGSPWGQALFGAGIGSLLFGMAAITTRSIALPIGLHAAWNLGDWIRGGKGSGGFWTPVVAKGSEAQVEFSGMLSYFLVMSLATLGFWFWHRFSKIKHAV